MYLVAPSFVVIGPGHQVLGRGRGVLARVLKPFLGDPSRLTLFATCLPTTVR